MRSPNRSNYLGLWLIILYMFLEYVRPQSFIPGLAYLRIPMFVQIAIMLALLRSNVARLKSKESVMFLVFVCLMMLHIPLATNNYLAYWTTRTMALQFVVFLGIIGFLDTYEKFDKVLTFWVIVAVLCAAKGYYEGGRIPNSSFLGDENDFSLFLNMMVPLAFFKGYTASKKSAKLLFYGGVVVLIMGTVSSLSRGGFVGLLSPVLYCWWKSAHKLRSAFVALIVGGLLVAYAIPDSYWDEMRTITEEGTTEGTGSHRIYMWKGAWAMFLEHPLAGVGPGNFPVRFGEYEPPGGLHGRSEAWRAVHSVYFTLLPELGLAGCLLFFGMLWTNLKERRHLRKAIEGLNAPDRQQNAVVNNKLHRLEALGWGLTGAIIAYLVSGAFLSVLYYGHFWLIMGLSVARNSIVRELLLKIDQQARPATARFPLTNLATALTTD
ncbi:MAG: hypothetical protein Kow0099_26660 [Candidatus Abyssubacteria bacterium]